MADKKISALTGATTPLAGTEVLPIVQSGSTVKVSVANLTAGRALDATSVNKVAITAPATGATLTIVEGKTLTASNSLTLAGTDATTMTFPTTSATVARTDAANSFTGDQTLTTGNLIVSDGKGIDFSVDPSAAGMTSELLDDYEEGTFTPSFAGLTIGDGSVFGRYTKTGRMVNVEFGFIYGSTSSISGSIGDITGLPFTVVNITSNVYQLVVGVIFKPGTGWFSVMSNLQSNTSQLLVTTTLSGVAITSTTPTVFASGTTLTLSVTYEAA
jgi:hypothetical protein